VPIYRWTAEQLAARNLSGAEQIITEWNPCNGKCLPPYQTNAWAACDFAQTVLVHATLGVTMSAPYPLCGTNSDVRCPQPSPAVTSEQACLSN